VTRFLDEHASKRLELHPAVTRIVYCKDSNRSGEHEHIAFDFLGYTFRPRRSKNRQGEFFVSFAPAISTKAAKSIRTKDPPVATGFHQEQAVTGGSGATRQPCGPWLDELLRAVLSLAVCSSPPVPQRGARAANGHAAVL